MSALGGIGVYFFLSLDCWLYGSGFVAEAGRMDFFAGQQSHEYPFQAALPSICLVNNWIDIRIFFWGRYAVAFSALVE